MAKQWGLTVRSVLEANEMHANIFRDETARPDMYRGWSNDGLYLKGDPVNSKDPSYRALGYGTSIIGARLHGIILDDPMTQEQAISETEQFKAKNYHDMTVDSRLHPGGWEIMITTRWHEQDLAAHLQDRDDWEVLVMPAIGYWGENEALWPERFSLEMLQQKQKDIGGSLFACMYQGDPTSLGGAVFREPSWFRPYPPDFRDIRPSLSIMQYWDLAFSEKTSADYTCCVTAGVDKDQNVYIINVLRKRLGWPALIEAMVSQAHTFQPIVVGVEESAYRQTLIQQLCAEVGRQVRSPFLAIRSVHDKTTRAMVMAAKAEAGKLYIDRGAAWAEGFVAECMSFPRGTNDDQVDAGGGVCQMILDRSAPVNMKPRPYSVRPRKKQDPQWDPFEDRKKRLAEQFERIKVAV
jgi:predicted phage terminase large subunit-like protein